jgi:hypothetical protein
MILVRGEVEYEWTALAGTECAEVTMKRIGSFVRYVS